MITTHYEESSEQPSLPEGYEIACELEHKLWSLVKDRHPGQPEHNPTEWRAWLDAVHRVRVLAQSAQGRRVHR